MTQRLDEINKKDRVRGPTRILPQMGSMPKKKINTIALTKLDIYKDPSYRCFTFNQEDMVPTVEEYMTFKVPSNPNMTTIGQMKTMKGKSECLFWEFLKSSFPSAKMKNGFSRCLL